MLPEDFIKKRAKKVVDSGMNIPLAELTEAIETNEKLDALISKEVVIPPPPKELRTMLEGVLSRLDTLTEEIKKKEELEYDLQIDDETREKLTGKTGEKGERGDRGEKGEDGRTPGVDDIKAAVEAILPSKEALKTVTDTPEIIRDKLETLDGDNRLDFRAIKGFNKEGLTKEILDLIPFRSGGGVRSVVSSDGSVNITSSMANGSGIVDISVSGGVGNTFETVIRDLNCYPAAITYNSDNRIDTIVYTVPSGTITQTISYLGSSVNTMVLSGDTPSGIDLTKTFSYSGINISSIAYS